MKNLGNPKWNFSVKDSSTVHYTSKIWNRGTGGKNNGERGLC